MHAHNIKKKLKTFIHLFIIKLCNKMHMSELKSLMSYAIKHEYKT